MRRAALCIIPYTSGAPSLRGRDLRPPPLSNLRSTRDFLQPKSENFPQFVRKQSRKTPRRTLFPFGQKMEPISGSQHSNT
jgi:hypothetical protein